MALTDPVEQAMAHKAFLQTDILKQPPTFGRNEPGGIADIGIFRVFPTIAAVDWVSPSGGFKIEAGQTYLDFHMPKSENIKNRIADKSYEQIAEYMQDQPNILFIMGVTYRIMAIHAQRKQQFETEQIELPESIQKYASATWQNMMPEAKPKQFETTHIVWLDRERFIERWSAA